MCQPEGDLLAGVCAHTRAVCFAVDFVKAVEMEPVAVLSAPSIMIVTHARYLTLQFPASSRSRRKHQRVLRAVCVAHVESRLGFLIFCRRRRDCEEGRSAVKKLLARLTKPPSTAWPAACSVDFLQIKTVVDAASQAAWRVRSGWHHWRS